jgi:hypothetical protein
MKTKIVNLAVLMTLLANSGTSLAKGGDPTTDDNPSASDLYVLQYGAEKQNDADAPDITEAELETIKVTPPPEQTPVSSITGNQLANAWPRRTAA